MNELQIYKTLPWLTSTLKEKTIHAALFAEACVLRYNGMNNAIFNASRTLINMITESVASKFDFKGEPMAQARKKIIRSTMWNYWPHRTLYYVTDDPCQRASKFQEDHLAKVTQQDINMRAAF